MKYKEAETEEDLDKESQVKSVCLSPEPDGTQFPQLILPVNSQLTTLRAPEVPSQLAGQFSTPRQCHSAVLAVTLSVSQPSGERNGE